jgi:hypothetical protein
MRARQDEARAQAVERLARWKRRIGTGAVVVFGALIALIGVGGARGAPGSDGNPPSGSPSATTRADRSGGDDDRAFAPSTAPDDGFFGNQGGGYGFGGDGSQSAPLGQSGAS